VKIIACIFNHQMFKAAVAIRESLRPAGVDGYILSSDDDPYVKNAGYTGLWNRALNTGAAAGADAVMIVTADVTIPDAGRLISRALVAFGNRGVWEYAPCVDEQAFKDDPTTLTAIVEDPEMKIVPRNAGMCTVLRDKLLVLVGHIPPEVNWHGWGIDVLTGLTARRHGRMSVRDYGVWVSHPPTPPGRYDEQAARRECHELMKLRGVTNED
jgi:hypothetical protein